MEKEQHSDILNRLGNLEEGQNELKLDIGILKQMIVRFQESSERSDRDSLILIGKHNDTLYGNGHEGLTTKISSLEGIRHELVSHGKLDRWLFGSIITLLLFILTRIYAH